MKKQLLVLIGLLCTTLMFAQKHDYTWYLGYNGQNGNGDWLGGVTIDFKKKPPFVYAELKKISMSHYSVVCSDSSGQILFYTNGISIRNKTHAVMENGDTINPGYYWKKYKDDSYPGAANVLSFPAPGLHNHYYLIHLAYKRDSLGNDALTPLYYTLIDGNANAGLGRVVKKNIILVEGTNAYPYILAPSLVKHGNGRDWWLVTGRFNSPEHLVYLFSPEGITGPFVQIIGPPFPKLEGGGNPLFTPDGDIYIRPDARNGPRIYDFNRCTGQLSNLRIIPYTQPFYTYSLVISPNSRFLYGASIGQIMQFDLSNEDISASMDTVAMYDGFTSPFPPWETAFSLANLGPDSKIYFSTTSTTTALHVINYPDLPGTACDIQQHGVILPKFNDHTMHRFPNYRLGKWAAAPCDTLPFQPPPGGSGFTDTPYAPARMHSDTTYRLMTPVPDKTQPPEIYFRKKELPEAPEVWRGRFQRIDKQAVLNDEPANDEGTKHD